MKTTIGILFWCTLTVSGQENRPITFAENDYASKINVDVPRQINQVSTSSFDEDVERAYTDGITYLTTNLNSQVPIVMPAFHHNNAAYGPLTIAGALSLIMLASVGETSDEIANVLGLTSVKEYYQNPLAVHRAISRLIDKIDTKEISSADEVVSYATAIFVQSGFRIRQPFLKACNETYHSDIISLNFRKKATEAQNEINSWVSRHTNKKIPELLSGPPPPETTAIIASVLYFKAAWEQPFFAGLTKPKPFFVNGRNQPSDRNVDMMANGGEFPYFKDRNLNVEIMGFPYKGKRITMYVLLPTDPSLENLRKLEFSLYPDVIHQLVNSTRKIEAVVTFPKLKIESSIDLKSVLANQLNVRSIFNPSKSNLALLSDINVVENYHTSPSTTRAHSNIQYHTTTPPTQLPPVRLSTTQKTGDSYVPGINNYQSNPNTINADQQNPKTHNNANERQQTVNQESNPVYAHINYPQNYGTQSNPQQSSSYGVPNNNAGRNFARSVRDIKNQGNYSAQQAWSSPVNNQNISSRNSANGCMLDIYNNMKCNPVGQTEHTVSPKFNQLDPFEELNQIRESSNLVNPGIYADQIIHKVYIEITESGTEAASVTGVSLNRSGGRVSFRVDAPFLFFIYHEETKLILFWGSVKNPTPSRSSSP